MFLAENRPIVELQSFSPGQYDLVFYVLVIAGFGLFASFLYSVTSRSEISARYRPAVLASMCITAVATLSYTILVIKWDSGFTLQGNLYVPNQEARLSVVPRYMDWSITVPLLTAEIIAVCTIAGKKARNLRSFTMAAAFLMIFTGFIGAKLIDEGTNVGALWLWGLISSVFLACIYPAVIYAVKGSMGELSEPAGRTLTVAATLLLSLFVVYPLVYAIPVFFDPTPKWTVTIQIAFSVADLAAKAGFGALIHKVAKLRTAQDLAAGIDTNPESVWVSQVKESDGVQAGIKRIIESSGDGGAARPAVAVGGERPIRAGVGEPAAHEGRHEQVVVERSVDPAAGERGPLRP